MEETGDKIKETERERADRQHMINQKSKLLEKTHTKTDQFS